MENKILLVTWFIVCLIHMKCNTLFDLIINFIFILAGIRISKRIGKESNKQ